MAIHVGKGAAAAIDEPEIYLGRSADAADGTFFGVDDAEACRLLDGNAEHAEAKNGLTRPRTYWH